MITRRQAIAAGVLAAAARPVAAFAADPDDAPLAALAAYAREVVEQYDALLQKSAGDERRGLEQLRGRARAASAALPKTAGPPTPGDATLETLIAAEEAFVAGCYTALQSLSGQRHLKGCAAFMADAGRRLVVLRKLSGEPLLPRAFETGGA